MAIVLPVYRLPVPHLVMPSEPRGSQIGTFLQHALCTVITAKCFAIGCKNVALVVRFEVWISFMLPIFFLTVVFCHKSQTQIYHFFGTKNH